MSQGLHLSKFRENHNFLSDPVYMYIQIDEQKPQTCDAMQ